MVNYVCENIVTNSDINKYKAYIVQSGNSELEIENGIKFMAVSDSGANISVTSYKFADQFGFKYYKWDKCINIRFGNSSIEQSQYYIICGDVVGRVAVINNATETLLSLWWIASRGFSIELCADTIVFKVTLTNEIVYSQKSDHTHRQWNVDLFALMKVKLNENIVSVFRSRLMKSRIPYSTVYESIPYRIC